MAITPCLWFQSDMEGALARYVDLFDDSEVLSLQSVPGDRPFQLAEWRMQGSFYRGLCQPAPFDFTESISLSVDCADQAEVDRLWFGLLEGGGTESMCGWLKDPWGLSWQIVPRDLPRLLGDPDPARRAAANAALMGQQRIVIAELESAAAAAGS